MACSDPAVPFGDLPNPFGTLLELSDEMAHRMIGVDCDIDGYRIAIDRGNELLAVYDEEGFGVGGIFHKSILSCLSTEGRDWGRKY
jgi:hypothetical protein